MPCRRALSMLLLALYLPACASYSQTATPLTKLTTSPRPPGRIRVTRTDSTRVEIWQPFVRNDSVIGQNAVPQKATRYLVVPLADVGSVEVRQPSPLLTLGLIGVAAALTLSAMALFWTAACSAGDDSLC